MCGGCAAGPRSGHERGWRGARMRLIERLAGPLDGLLHLLFEDGGGLAVVDRAGRIVRANAALVRMSGVGAASVGRPVLALFADGAAGPWLAGALAGRHGASLNSALTPNVSQIAHGSTAAGVPVSVTAAPVLEADGGLSGLVLRFADMSAQRRLEAQLVHGQKLQAVGRLAGGIAHDFNNLLTAILGAAEDAAARPMIDEVTREDLAQIQASAGRGAALVRQLLAFGRQQTLQPRVVRLNEAVEGIAALLRRLIGSRVRLVLELATPEPLVRVDPDQLDQVLVNLAVNARDAMPSGGTLTLRTGQTTLFRPLPQGDESIPPGDYATIEVEDTGVGIEADVLPRIFDPFFTTRREQGGNGLGLSTVHGIVRQSNGFLGVESELGRFTRIRVHLPRQLSAAFNERRSAPRLGASRPRTGAAPSAEPSRTLLLVDDEPPVRRVAARVLARAGWSVIEADCAETALECARDAGDVALVVSDVIMPGLDGHGLVRALRLEQPDLPAILVSGYVEDGVRRSLEAEAISFLSKPYALAELTGLVERVMLAAAEPG